MNYHIVYNNFKDYAELFIKNIDFSKANINKVLFLHIGDEEAISEIIENTNFKNAEFYIKDEGSIYDIIETLYSEKVHKFLEYNNMEFDLIIANPPYGSLGNPIISEAISHLADNGIASVLMPLSCYKKNELHRHVETFELANPKLFQDAHIAENLCICSLRKEDLDKYTWKSIILESLDKRYYNYYKYNIDNNKGLIMTQQIYKSPDNYNIDTDFIESGRCVTRQGGSGFGKGGCGYKYNVIKAGYEDCWINNIGVIHFPNKKAKNSFCKWWYNGKKFESFSSRVAIGLGITTCNRDTFMFIPQIDWTNISDKYPDYEKDPDFYVLKEMGLKWNDDKTKIVQA